jgi:RNA polymerase sigma-70 factor (ECF subfamily)
MSSSPARYFPGEFARRKGADGEHTDFVDSKGAIGGAVEDAEEITDEALIIRLKQKDVEALGILYRRYARLIYSISFRQLRNSAEAEDLVHEVFLCIYRKCKSFDAAKGAARSWLIQLTYSKCFDYRDYLRARHGYQQGDGDAAARSPEVPAHKEERDPAYLVLWNPRMQAAFRNLSKEQQLTLMLYYFHGYTFEEIGEKLGYTYGNVKHHVYRGIEHLRNVVFDGVARRSADGARQALKCKPEELAG